MIIHILQTKKHAKMTQWKFHSTISLRAHTYGTRYLCIFLIVQNLLKHLTEKVGHRLWRKLGRPGPGETSRKVTRLLVEVDVVKWPVVHVAKICGQAGASRVGQQSMAAPRTNSRDQGGKKQWRPRWVRG